MSDDLFGNPAPEGLPSGVSVSRRSRKGAPVSVPLAELLRPHSLEQVIGQAHLLAPGKPLHTVFAAGKPQSMILWGPPGVGKTTLARLMAHAFDHAFIALSVVFSAVKNIRAAVDQAQMHAAQRRSTIPFIDEIHRFKKTVKLYINQILTKLFVQILVFTHCSVGVKHG
jgi:replication-associated recombination protein RarA